MAPAAGPSVSALGEWREAIHGRVAAEAETSCCARAEGDRPVILEACIRDKCLDCYAAMEINPSNSLSFSRPF